MMSFILMKPQYRPFEAFRQFELPDRKEFFALARLGIPIAAALFMEVSLFAVVALLMGTLGAPVVAGHQIALNVASITFMIPLGISMAISVRVGQAVGRNDLAGARLAGISGIVLAASFMAGAALFILVFPGFVAGIYTQDPEVKTIAVNLLLMASIFQISDGLQVSGAGALRGLKDTKIPMVITFIAYWVVGLPLAYILGISLQGGPRSMWVGFICGLSIAAFLLNARFHAVTRRLLRRLHERA
jgi:MATE family multidrug resistance protein